MMVIHQIKLLGGVPPNEALCLYTGMFIREGEKFTILPDTRDEGDCAMLWRHHADTVY